MLIWEPKVGHVDNSMSIGVDDEMVELRAISYSSAIAKFQINTLLR